MPRMPGPGTSSSTTAKLLTLDANGNNAKSPKFDAKNIVQYGCMVENLTWQLEVWCLSNGSGFYSKDGSKVTINDPAAIATRSRKSPTSTSFIMSPPCPPGSPTTPCSVPS